MGRNSAGGRLVRLYAALALLPPARTAVAFAELPQAAESLGLPLNAAFHRYFMDYWMTRVSVLTKQIEIASPTKPLPRASGYFQTVNKFQIRPETFSVYGRAHRTSNTAESFHAYLKHMLGASPNIWRFTRKKKYCSQVARSSSHYLVYIVGLFFTYIGNTIHKNK